MPYIVQNLKPSTYATYYLFELCQIVVTLLRDVFHTPMIKITYTPHILPTSTLEVEHPFHKIKTPCYSWLFSPRLKGHELLKKREKNGHMKVQSIQKKSGHMKVQCVSKES